MVANSVYDHIDLLLRITTALRTRSSRAQGDDQAIRGLLQLLGELFRDQKLADADHETLVTFEQAAMPPLAAWVHEELARAGYRFRGLYETGIDTRDRILAAAAGHGVALLPGSTRVIADAGPIVVRRPLDPPLTMPDTVVAWRTRPPAQLRALTKEIRELARALRETAA